MPVISIDAKKKELVGNFSSAVGQEYQPKGLPLQEVNVYDFLTAWQRVKLRPTEFMI